MKDTPQALKKLVVAALVIGTFIVYCLLYNRPNAAASSLGGGVPNSSGNPNATASSGGHYKDGTYTGSPADAQWGLVQVQAVIQNGSISNVQFVQYPNDRQRSILINQYADPILINEAIQAQSAQVDVVTGATDTSDAFVQSLSDALSQAQ